ncbi:alpha carbonic anhydrase 7-like [Andrographis paniculata]|uniref:alpha carbonic anhydrase 7-like n=1 Tax=Andrographis paniculata TaxID=175694 RepID=UPI0021E852B2|nr:alpha carbonic anhydrase 7-like [Andrographis paniculata]
MTKREFKPLGFSLLVLFSILHVLINAQEVENEREFEYAEKSEKGPSKWGKMKKEWSACNQGKMQSPIDLTNRRIPGLWLSDSHNKDLRNYTYRPSNATLTNRGHDIQIRWSGDGGSLAINTTEYRLRYAHWHAPSEHTINGRRYDLELHLVHLTPAGNKIAVVGVLYKIGKPDLFLSKLMSNISSMIDKKGGERNVGVIDPNVIDIRSDRYYRYMGSLTIPPCTEGVVWTINKKVKTVSKDQVKLLRDAVHDYAEANARPLQPHNSRGVYLYGPDITN